jgi:Xaa-Pro aminopeptidase
MRMAGDDAILVLPAAPERVRSRDTHYPYRQDSDFWYLTGFAEPEAVLVLVPGRAHGETILFCRERDPDREAWDGPRAGQEGAVDTFGMDDAYPIADLDEILPGLLEGRTRVYYHFGRDAEFDLKLIGWLNRVRAQARTGAQSPHEFLALGHLLDEMRLFKSTDEIKLMQRAADISVAAHEAAMRIARAGVREFELQAELERVFRANDAESAYGSIVGAGANACVLHYRANNATARAGDLVLIDAGAEYRNYAADITRTFPIDGRFSKEQRALHDLVGAAQRAALAKARPGVAYDAGHVAAVETLTEGLLRLGLLKGTLEKAIADGAYRASIGTRPATGSAWTCTTSANTASTANRACSNPAWCSPSSPASTSRPTTRPCPAKWRGIGIRTEDDIVITNDGHRILTDALVRDADEIEAFMAG